MRICPQIRIWLGEKQPSEIDVSRYDYHASVKSGVKGCILKYCVPPQSNAKEMKRQEDQRQRSLEFLSLLLKPQSPILIENFQHDLVRYIKKFVSIY